MVGSFIDNIIKCELVRVMAILGTYVAQTLLSWSLVVFETCLTRV